MPERKNILKAALVIAVGGLTYTAIRNAPSPGELVLSVTRQVLNYEARKADGTINQALQKIPGRLPVAETLAEMLAVPDSWWHSVNPLPFRIQIDPDYFRVDCRPSIIDPELLIAKAYKTRSGKSNLRWGISSEAKTDFWIVGQKFNPIAERTISIY
jgi:hypothetical protein